MPVNYTPPTSVQLLPVIGVALGTAAAAIKNWDRADVVLIALDAGAHGAGVFTQNRFFAAPVAVCREHLEHDTATRALLINAGNANAGNGRQGIVIYRRTRGAFDELVNGLWKRSHRPARGPLHEDSVKRDFQWAMRPLLNVDLVKKPKKEAA